MSVAVVVRVQNSLLHRLETLSLLSFGIHICELKQIATTPFVPTVNWNLSQQDKTIQVETLWSSSVGSPWFRGWIEGWSSLRITFWSVSLRWRRSSNAMYRFQPWGVYIPVSSFNLCWKNKVVISSFAESALHLVLRYPVSDAFIGRNHWL